jgi:hypothetical protein
METPNEWPAAVWQDINDGVMKEVSKIRIAQKVFPTRVFDTSPAEIRDDVMDFTVSQHPSGSHQHPGAQGALAQDLPSIGEDGGQGNRGHAPAHELTPE